MLKARGRLCTLPLPHNKEKAASTLEDARVSFAVITAVLFPDLWLVA